MLNEISVDIEILPRLKRKDFEKKNFTIKIINMELLKSVQKVFYRSL